MLPATRITNRSPSPWSNTISAGTRESEQPRMIANGRCSCDGTRRRLPSGAPPAPRDCATKRALPARRRSSASFAVSMLCPSRALAQHDVSRALARDVPRALVAERAQVEALHQVLARAEQNRPQHEVQLVDQPRAQVLPDRRHAAAEAYVLAARRGARLFARGADAFGDEAELRAARHPERRAHVVRQHEHRRVVGRLLAPPSLPAFVRPGSAHRAEHVAPEDPGADAREALLRHLIVDAGLAPVLAVHLAPDARGEEPLHQLGSADAEGILLVLVRPGAEAVQGDRKAPHKQFRHAAARSKVWHLTSRARGSWSRPP